GRRKSPKVGRLADLFDELVSIPDLVCHASFSLQVLMVQEEEIRRVDGRGSWRRRGQSIQDHKLLGVVEAIDLATTGDFLRFLPADLEQPFSNASLAARSGESIYHVRRMTYCLRKMGAIEAVGKNGNQLVFQVAGRGSMT
ncbi:MAG: hypothetical protein M1482_10415, partial [Chloroflexi bacterium]|nr:hypothetical protein [Chloroflexota bacterium]